jgi:hypothetical protein
MGWWMLMLHDESPAQELDRLRRLERAAREYLAAADREPRGGCMTSLEDARLIHDLAQKNRRRWMREQISPGPTNGERLLADIKANYVKGVARDA